MFCSSIGFNIFNQTEEYLDHINAPYLDLGDYECFVKLVIKDGKPNFHTYYHNWDEATHALNYALMYFPHIKNSTELSVWTTALHFGLAHYYAYKKYQELLEAESNPFPINSQCIIDNLQDELQELLNHMHSEARKLLQLAPQAKYISNLSELPELHYSS